VVEGGLLRGIVTREDLLRRMAVHLELGPKGKDLGPPEVEGS
jgi:hypothetical protein